MTVYYYWIAVSKLGFISGSRFLLAASISPKTSMDGVKVSKFETHNPYFYENWQLIFI
jgi:hypothetical protein